MRFVQFADCHLDSVIGGALRLPDAKKAVLREDIRQSVANACALATDRDAQFVLIPGDLFDHQCLRSDTLTFLADLFHGLAPIHVFIAPGNQDSLRPGSPYLPGSGFTWPDNVHVFRGSEFETVTIDHLDCAVTGVAHAHHGITDRLLARGIPRADATINILLFHDSRDGYRPAEKENVIPFSDQELADQGFTYAAVGHYHSLGVMTDGCPSCVGAAAPAFALTDLDYRTRSRIPDRQGALIILREMLKTDQSRKRDRAKARKSETEFV